MYPYVFDSKVARAIDHVVTETGNRCAYLTTCKAAWYIISVVSVCLHVCNTIKVRKPSRRKFIFARLVYLEGIRVKFVYEGHRVKVKVTGET